MTRLLALEHAQREYQSSLAARTSEKQQLEQAVTLARHRYEELQTESRAERESLSGHVRELERRALAVADRWQTELAEALLPLKDTSARVERLLNDVRSRRPADDDGWHEHEEKPGEPENPSTTEAAASDGESGEEVAWRF
jgi:hypothetical protein